jgi:hypothetical protein
VRPSDRAVALVVKQCIDELGLDARHFSGRPERGISRLGEKG